LSGATRQVPDENCLIDPRQALDDGVCDRFLRIVRFNVSLADRTSAKAALNKNASNRT
jgi:hypothetical protein